MLARRSAERFLPLLVLAVLLLLLYRLFGPVIRHPDEFLFAPGGDGLKNYYTFAYYLSHDRGAWFTGMNYPFGEQVVFTDNQPLLAFVGKAAQALGLPIGTHAIAVINGMMLLGLVLSWAVLYLLSRRALLPRGYAAVLALLLTLLAPQNERLMGHYALSYGFILPLIWYSWSRLLDGPRLRWPWAALYVATGFAAALLHPYYLLIGVFFVLTYLGVWAVQQAMVHRWRWLPLLAAGVTAVLPLLFFQLFMHFTDPVTDRPASPWGFLVYRSTWQSVFIPAHGPLRTFWQAAFRSNDPVWEGTAYIGLVASVVVLLTGAKALGYVLRRRWRLLVRPALPQPLQAATWAATILLIFSFGYPFVLGFEDWVQHLGLLRQFRSIGRFAWPFYYVAGLYAGFYLYVLLRYLAQRRAWRFGLGLMAVALLVWGAEGWVYLRDRAIQIRQHDLGRQLINPAHPFTERLADGGRSADAFQAILPLPYYAVGSEKFSILRSGAAIEESMKASLELGLPIATAMLSRTSTTQALQLVQLLSDPLLPAPLVRQFPSRKPLLLLTTHEAMLPAEKRLISQARLLFDSPGLALYELPLSVWETTQRQQETARFEARRASLLSRGPLLIGGDTTGLRYAAFTGQPGTGFGGPGVATGRGAQVVYRTHLPVRADTVAYEATVWLNARTPGAIPALTIRQAQPDGSVKILAEYPAKNSTDVFGDWVRAAVTFRPTASAAPIEVVIDGEEFAADNLLVRPLTTDVYYYAGPAELVYNNWPLY